MKKLHTTKEILKRIKLKDGKYTVTIRVLACGHEQVERSGGNAHLVLEARCKQCKDIMQPGAR